MISARRLDEWLRGLDTATADRALLAAGVDLDDLALSLAVRPTPVIHWALTAAELEQRTLAGAATLAMLLPDVRGLRLAVATEALPTDVLPRLLRVPAVVSAFIPVTRPAGALRRRPWRWPLRVGLVGMPETAVEELAEAVDASLLELARVEDEPGAVDIALIQRPLAAAVAELVDRKLVANAVVVLDAPLDRFPVTDALFATARAATGAVASALLPPGDVAGLLAALAGAASQGQGFDVALTTAAGRRVLLWAEPEAMVATAAPATGLESGAEPEAAPAVDEARWCQARVGDGNTLRRGDNAVTFFIGPREQDAVAAPDALDETALPFADEDADAFRLTVLFIPAAPGALAQQAELDLPRFGRTADVPFTLHVERAARVAAARILVLFRNRILQTAVLRGEVGAPVTLGEVVALVPALSDLDDRRAFDLALFANHTGGERMLTRHSSGTTHVSSAGGVPAIADRIAAVLGKAALDRRSLKRGLSSPAARELLVALAVQGRDLLKELRTELGELGNPSRIQLVTARSSWLLPLEVVYDREAPDPDAAICANYLADPAACTGACTLTPPRRSLCPNAFWGLSKTIERHRYDADETPALADGFTLVGSRQPRRGHRDLGVRRALLGASRRVTPADSAATVTALGHQAVAVAGWDAWETELAGADTDLLVLLPHTDYGDATLEIGASTLERGRIEPRHVTGDRDVDPILILFGCRTTGTGGDPGGFAARFFQEGASAVFHCSADLRNVHATELARRLTAALTLPGHRPRMLSDALVAFRREAVRDGLVAALGISAFGDADWRI